MNESLHRKRIVLILMSIFLMLSTLLLTGCETEQGEALITSYTELSQAVAKAEDGEILLVGDIDFLPTFPDIVHSYMSININKSITLKNGKMDSPAVFKNGGFLLSGSKVSGEGISCHFEGIIFDGCADYETMEASDFDYPWSEAEQTYTMFVPHDAQQALSFSGNVSASFLSCSFQNYMHEYGPVIDIRYGDYTDNAYLLDLFGDYSGCKIQLDFEDCRFEKNSAFYDGGAIYIDANQNVILRAQDCDFTENRSGSGEFRQGGGAIYANGAILQLSHCTLTENRGNYLYPGTDEPEMDTNRGGALMLTGGSLTVTDSVFSKNQSSMGGGISLTNMKAELEGCTFSENQAQAVSHNPDGLIGPWSNMGQGGAVYVEGMKGETVSLLNCTIENNTAQMAYGGVYGYYGGFQIPDDPSYRLIMTLCTYRDNTVKTSYDYTKEPLYPWCSHPGDITENPDFTMLGCVVVDDTFEIDFPHDDFPTAENGYNYLSYQEKEEVYSFSVDDEVLRNQLKIRYGDGVKDIHIGSNMDALWYWNNGKLPAFIRWIVVVSVAILLIAGVTVILLRRKELPSPVIAPTDTAIPIPEATAEQPRKQIVMTRYTDADIEIIISRVPETHLLTGRELEVLYEILRGHKQGEVAYNLGIEVSTVKDFYRKIYDKLNVPNKDGLLRMASEVLNL